MVSPSNLHRISIESPWNLHGISIESPWNLHGISMESPSRKHRLRSDEDPYIYTRCSESEGLSLRSESLKHQIKERIGDGGYPARSTAEGVGGFSISKPQGMRQNSGVRIFRSSTPREMDFNIFKPRDVSFSTLPDIRA